MSVINQVLNDLERRGEAAPLQQATGAITVRQMQPERHYRLVGIALLVFVLAGGWWVGQRYLAPAPAPVIIKPPALVAIPPLSPSVVAQVSIVEPIAVQYDAEPVSAASRVIVSSPVAVHVETTPPPVSVKKSATAVVQSVPVSKVVKQSDPRQLAEDAFRNANQLARSGQTKEAVDGYRLALSIDSSYVPAREALAAALLGSRQNAAAEQVLQEGLALDQRQVRFAMMSARLQVERDALSEALATLEKSLPYANQLPEYHAFIAALLQRQERHKEAIMHYQIALQRLPDSGVWLMGIGISLQALGRKGDAQDAYGRALATNSLSPELYAFVMQQVAGLK